MKILSSTRVLLLLAAAALLACAGCGRGSPGYSKPAAPPPSLPTVTAIAVAPTSSTLARGATLQLEATATYSDASSGDVTSTAAWTSSSNATATVSAAGVVTAVAAGTATLTATVGSISGATTITVTSPTSARLNSISVAPPRSSINAGSTAQFTATGSYSDGSTVNVSGSVTWSAAPSSVATITSAGLATALAAGTATISAQQGSVSGSTTLTVIASSTPTATLTSISVTPTGTTLATGLTEQFAATGNYSDGSTVNLTPTALWTSSASGVASVNGTGLVTGVAPGSTTISAKVGSITGSTGLTVQAASTHTDVLTYKYDLSRSGLNATETVLTTANVRSSTFGLKYSLQLDGQVFAQPLYAAQVSIGGSLHNVLYVVTEHNSAYAYDADAGTVLWHVMLNGSGETTSDDHSCDQVSPEIGATATPVIDRSAATVGAMYVVAMTKDGGGAYHQRLHALDIASGAELFGGAREIAASYPTHGGGTTTLAPGDYKERAGLLLLGGEVYTTWSSHCDAMPYSGWIIAYGGSTLAQTRVFNIGPNSGGNGPAVWMSGGAPAVDSANNIYILAANGAFETTLDSNGFPSLQDYGNSFLKLSTANQTLAVTDYFTMYNEVSESNADLDLGGGGPLLLPDVTDSGGNVKHLALGSGKDAKVYIVDRDNMGHFNASTNNIWQELDTALSSQVRSTPAWFNGHVYLSDRDHPLKSFTVSNARLPTAATSQTAASFVYPGTVPTVSAHGTSNGIVWAAESTNPGILHAYDATNLATELYNSAQAANGRDAYGAGQKYMPPTVADGKVFMVGKTEIAVFGLLH